MATETESWEEIEADPDFGKLNKEEQLQVIDAWKGSMRGELEALGGTEQHFAAVEQSASERRAKLLGTSEAKKAAAESSGIGDDLANVGNALVRGARTARQLFNLGQYALGQSVQGQMDVATPEQKALIQGQRDKGRVPLQDVVVEKGDAALPAIAADELAKRAIPATGAVKEFYEGDSWVKALATNPVEVVSSIIAESLPLMAPGMAGMMVASPAAGVAITAGSSFATEAASSILSSLESQGADLTKPESLKAALDDPTKMAKAKEFALQRGVPIAVFDAATAGVAGRLLKPALGKGAARVGAATAGEVAVQAAGGATGEATAQLASEGQISDPRAIVAEAVAEVGSAPAEALGNLRGEFREKAALIPEKVVVEAQNLEAVGLTETAKAVIETAVPPRPSPTKLRGLEVELDVRDPATGERTAETMDAAAAVDELAQTRAGLAAVEADLQAGLTLEDSIAKNRGGLLSDIDAETLAVDADAYRKQGRGGYFSARQAVRDALQEAQQDAAALTDQVAQKDPEAGKVAAALLGEASAPVATPRTASEPQSPAPEPAPAEAPQGATAVEASAETLERLGEEQGRLSRSLDTTSDPVRRHEIRNEMAVVSAKIEDLLARTPESLPPQGAPSRVKPTSSAPVRTVAPEELPDAAQASQQKWYHGTGAEIAAPEAVSSTFSNIESLFGSGVYLTDSPEVAASYGRARGKKGAKVYEVGVNVRNVLNFERPLPPEAITAIKAATYEELRPAIDEVLASNPNATGSELWGKLAEAVREHSADNLWPKSEYAEMFQGIESELRMAGFDAITHIGGLRTGDKKKQHRVLILLDPRNEYAPAADPTPATVASVGPYSPAPASFAEQVQAAARVLTEAEGKFGDHKAFIEPVHRKWQEQTGQTMPLEEFKAALLKELRSGTLELTRNDAPPGLLSAEQKTHTAASLITDSSFIGGDQTFNFVTIKPEGKAAAAPVEQAAPEPTVAVPEPEPVAEAAPAPAVGLEPPAAQPPAEIRQGEADVAATLDSHRARLEALAAKMGSKDPEDVAQEAIIAVLRTRPDGLRPKDNPFGLLSSKLSQIVADRYRAATAAKRGSGEATADIDDEAVHVADETAADPVAAAQVSDLRAAVDELLAGMTSREQSIFALKEEGNSIQEIADTLGIPYNQAKNSLAKVQGKLQKKLTRFKEAAILNPFYDPLSKERWAEKEKQTTQPIKPTPEEKSAIAASYQSLMRKSGFPSVRIADVMEGAGFTEETLDRGRGIVSQMYRDGDIVSLGLGDWSAADARTQAWGVVVVPGDISLQMRMSTMAMSKGVSGSLLNPFAKKASVERPGEFDVSKLLVQAYAPGGLRRLMLRNWLGKHGPLPVEMRREIAQSGRSADSLRDSYAHLARDLSAAVDAAKGDREAILAMVSEYMEGDPTAFNRLPTPRIQETARVARNALDHVSEIIAQSGAVNTGMGNIITQNLGAWMKRYYAAFDPEANWNLDALQKRASKDTDEGRKTRKILENARRFIEADLKEQAAKDPLVKSDPPAVEGVMRQLTDRSLLLDFVGGGNGINLETSSFLRRKDIPKPLRELMGEETNPILRVEKSAEFLSQAITRHRMQERLREIGLKSGVFWVEQRGRFSVLVPAPTPGRSPWRGLWTTPEFRDAMNEAALHQADVQAIEGAFLKAYGALQGQVKFNLVVANPRSWLVNALGSGWQALTTGALFHMPKRTGRLAAASFRSVWLSGKTLDPTDAKALVQQRIRALRSQLMEAGVIGQELTVKDFETSVGESLRLEVLAYDQQLKDRAIGAARGALVAGVSTARATGSATAGVIGAAVGGVGGAVVGNRAINRAQQSIGQFIIGNPDATWKAMVYFDNYGTLLESGMAEPEARKLAGERTRQTMPTYSEIPEGLRRVVARIPLPRVNIFFQFVYEQWRNNGHNIRIALQDVSSPNPVLKASGFRRLAGVAVMGAGMYGIAVLLRSLYDWSEEKLKAIARSFVPEWNENSVILPFSKPNGESFSFIDAKYLLPHFMFAEIFQALKEGKTPEESAMNAVAALVDDFIGRDNAAQGPISEALANRKGESGKPVTTKTGWDGIEDRVVHAIKNVGAIGAAEEFRRIRMASTGEAADYGTTYDLEERLYGLAALRVNRFEFRKNFDFRLADKNAEWSAITSAASKERLKIKHLEKTNPAEFQRRVAVIEADRDKQRQEALVSTAQLFLDALVVGMDEKDTKQAEEGFVGNLKEKNAVATPLRLSEVARKLRAQGKVEATWEDVVAAQASR